MPVLVGGAVFVAARKAVDTFDQQAALLWAYPAPVGAALGVYLATTGAGTWEAGQTAVLAFASRVVLGTPLALYLLAMAYAVYAPARPKSGGLYP